MLIAADRRKYPRRKLRPLNTDRGDQVMRFIAEMCNNTGFSIERDGLYNLKLVPSQEMVTSIQIWVTNR
jgi:hypothetical protein